MVTQTVSDAQWNDEAGRSYGRFGICDGCAACCLILDLGKCVFLLDDTPIDVLAFFLIN